MSGATVKGDGEVSETKRGCGGTSPSIVLATDGEVERSRTF